MGDDGRSLPSVEEVGPVFAEFKEVLKAAEYRTPLQRAERMVSRRNLITLSQHRRVKVERVFNLLPSGLNTRLAVDFLQLLAQQRVQVRVPVTLLAVGKTHVLLRSDASGLTFSQSVSERFGLNLLRQFERKSPHPAFVHKGEHCPTSFHHTFASACAAWEAAEGAHQLQQFVPSPSSTRSLLRAHYHAAQHTANYYYIRRGREKTAEVLSRTSFLDSPELGQSEHCDAVFMRQRADPDLTAALAVCGKVLATTLKPWETLTEAVFDFTLNRRRQWVFLACQGFTFSSSRSRRTQTLDRPFVMDLKYLMYPVVVRHHTFKRRMNWTSKLQTIASKENISIQGLMDTMFEFSALELDSSRPRSHTPTPKKPPVTPGHHRYEVERGIIDCAVRRFESLQNSYRRSKEASGSVDYLSKYGGERQWAPSIAQLCQRFRSDERIVPLFPHKVETRRMEASMLRVIRGDFSSYSKETLRRIHSRHGIRSYHYTLFMQLLQAIVNGLVSDSDDLAAILQRFEDLREFLCEDAVD